MQRLYSELAIARESAVITCVLAETQGQVEEWEKGEGVRYAMIIRGC